MDLLKLCINSTPSRYRYPRAHSTSDSIQSCTNNQTLQTAPQELFRQARKKNCPYYVIPNPSLSPCVCMYLSASHGMSISKKKEGGASYTTKQHLAFSLYICCTRVSECRIRKSEIKKRRSRRRTKLCIKHTIHQHFS